MATSHLPTRIQIQESREKLKEHENEVQKLAYKIQQAQQALEDLIADSKKAISILEDDKRKVEHEIQVTLEFLSPMRRLPDDLLRQIFLHTFANNACTAWVLSAVCSSWRRLALNTPRLWSKIRIATTQSSNPDTIRLWLERSGPHVPLDIEIYLQVPAAPRKRRRPGTPVWNPPGGDTWWHSPLAPTIPLPPHHLPLNHPPWLMQNVMPPMLPTPAIAPPHLQAAVQQTNESSVVSRSGRGRSQPLPCSSWGHIVVFYLTEQMHRWTRFVFRFDRQFDSISALRNISRDAPILEEFEVSCADPLLRPDTDIYNLEWQWLPCADGNAETRLPKLRTVALQYVPFKWSSPLIAANLRSISIRSLYNPGIGTLSNTQVTLDRLLHIISANPALEQVTLHFQNAQSNVLPLDSVTLPSLKILNLGGSYQLITLLEALITPSLESLTLSIERQRSNDTITNFIARSSYPPITFLSLSYQNAAVGAYYPNDGDQHLWGFLTALPHLKTLQIGLASLDSLMDALSHVDEQSGAWLVPQLKHLALRYCNAHGDGILRLISLVEVRNPALTSSGVAQAVGGIGGLTAAFTPAPVVGTGHPARLKSLELYECASLGDDILKWLKGKIADVKYTEPTSR